MMEDPWSVLGVEPGASAAEIREAWRRQVSHWHPDRNPSPNATARLQQVNDAFASLERGGAAPTGARFACGGPILAGLHGTVFGRVVPLDQSAHAGVRVGLEIPLVPWLLDEPVTLAVALGHDLTTIVTFLHPRRFHHGARLAFAKSALATDGTATDLLVTLHIAVPTLETAVASGLPSHVML